MARSSTSHHKFDNAPLLTAAGEINMDYVRKSARARAISQDPTGNADPVEIKIWEEKLYGMAHMMRTAFERDHSADTRRRLAVSALIGQCEAIAKSGTLPDPTEQSLRILIAQTVTAFNMPASELAA